MSSRLPRRWPIFLPALLLATAIHAGVLVLVLLQPDRSDKQPAPKPQEMLISLGGMAAAGEEASTAKYALFAAGILATLIVTWIIGKKAREKLKHQGVETSNS